MQGTRSMVASKYFTLVCSPSIHGTVTIFAGWSSVPRRRIVGVNFCAYSWGSFCTEIGSVAKTFGLWQTASYGRVCQNQNYCKTPSSMWSTVPPRATKFSQMTSQDYTMNTHGRLHPAVEWVEPQDPFSHPQYLQCIFWLLNGFNKICCDDWPLTTPSWYVSWPYLHSSKGLGLRVSSQGYAIY